MKKLILILGVALCALSTCLAAPPIVRDASTAIWSTGTAPFKSDLVYRGDGAWLSESKAVVLQDVPAPGSPFGYTALFEFAKTTNAQGKAGVKLQTIPVLTYKVSTQNSVPLVKTVDIDFLLGVNAAQNNAGTIGFALTRSWPISDKASVKAGLSARGQQGSTYDFGFLLGVGGKF